MRQADVSPSSPSPESADDWDRGVLGTSLYSGLASGSSSHLQASLRELTLLQAVRLALAVGDERHWSDKTVAAALVQSSPILAMAESRLRDEQPMQLGFSHRGSDGIWVPGESLPLARLDAQFAFATRALLKEVGALAELSDRRLSWLNNLLFHPLLNAKIHGYSPSGVTLLWGLLVRRVSTRDSYSTSEALWRSAQPGDTRGTAAFLECTIHDCGVGIARHFAAARDQALRSRLDLDRALRRHLAHDSEWTLLNAAFERHQSSAPVTFARVVSGGFEGAGIGLAAMLAAVKALGAYVEVRTGSYRVWQCYQEGDHIDAHKLMRPHQPPTAATPAGGTLVRVLVPLGLREHP